MQGELDFGTQPLRDARVGRSFLGWDQPMLDVLSGWLLERKEEMVGMLLVVPTVQSGRRVRQELAGNGGALSPEVVTPSYFGLHGDIGNHVAELTAWTDVLMKLDLEDMRGLFPRDPVGGENFGWAISMARQLLGVKNSLDEACLTLDEVSRRSPEGERWADFVKLERKVDRFLAEWMGSRKGFQLGEGVKRVVIAGVSDLNGYARNVLQRLLDSGVRVDVLVYAPDFMKGRFDEWGCVEVDVWCKETIPIPSWEEDIILVEDPEQASKWLLKDIAEKGSSNISLGLCDRDLGGQVERVFRKSGWNLYNPEGRSLESSGFFQFLRSLLDWLQPWRPVEALIGMLRLEEGDSLLNGELGRLFLVKELDSLSVDTLLESIKDAVWRVKDAEVKKTVDSILLATEELEKGGVYSLRLWVSKALGCGDERVAEGLVDPLVKVFDTLERIEANRGRMPLRQIVELVLQGLSDQVVYDDAAGCVLDLEGWMELMFDGAKEVYLIGLHEGCVPDQVQEDSFLPEGFKEVLRMNGSRFRYARDSYLMHSLLMGREKVKVILTKVNENGDPKTPSRLLLKSNGEDLALRVKKLFGGAEEKVVNARLWKRDWTLNLDKIENIYAVREGERVASLSPSAIRDYLSCPMRFYLKRILKMKRYEARKREMNAMDFGNVVHEAVELFGRDEGVRDSDSGEEIAKYFDKVLDEIAVKFYGFQANLAVRIQLESARERLRAFAYEQAEDRRKGWRIEHVEFKIGRSAGDDEVLWDVAGHPITMMLDRVDRLEGTERLRVLDYKTSAKGKKPLHAHLQAWKEEENRPQLGELVQAVMGAYKPVACRWQNLQVPLYTWFAQDYFKLDSIPEVGYVNLPKAVSETRFEVWEGFGEEFLESSKVWTIEAVKRIERGDFGSPAIYSKNENWDEFKLMAMDGMKEAFGII